MSEDILKINSISQLHQLLDIEKPKHPLISVVDVSKIKMTEDWLNVKIVANLYYVALKTTNCGMQYGRNTYDFEEGVLAFAAPKQVIIPTSMAELDKEDGWMLFFHPDLIRTTPLGEDIDNFTFFSYDTHEALHLSDDEKESLRSCVNMIKDEYNQRIDNHSQRVIVSSLELLFSLCSRYYERQFNTRAAQNKDIVTKIEHYLKEYYKSGQLREYGPPSLQYFADKVNLSSNYLSDLLKKETGRSAKDHINDFLVDKAKTQLLSTEDSVSEIAYELGFNYPHYFSRMFKSKTGVTPQKYRELQMN